MSDRIAGVALLLAGLAIALEASTFDVAFLTDPVGPKALPLLAGGILLIGGIHLAIRPARSGSWPAPAVLTRLAMACLTCAAYAAVLPMLGFVVTTIVAVTLLAWLFDGPRTPSAIAAVALTVTLWVVFVPVLGLRLPVGTLFGAP